jgi:hypothetical protein
LRFEAVLQKVDVAASAVVADAKVKLLVAHRLDEEDVIVEGDKDPALVGVAVEHGLDHLEGAFGEDSSEVEPRTVVPDSILKGRLFLLLVLLDYPPLVPPSRVQVLDYAHSLVPLITGHFQYQPGDLCLEGR